MIVKILYAICFCSHVAHVAGSQFATTSHRSSHGSPEADGSTNVDHSSIPATYESTITTEMSYYADDSPNLKTEKKRNHHAEYEYIAAGGHPAETIHPKSGKKGVYHQYEHSYEPTDDDYTYEPTDYDNTYEPTDYGYADELTYYPKHSKSGKKAGYHGHEHTHAPTHMGTDYHYGKGSKSGHGHGHTHAPTHMGSDYHHGKGSKSGTYSSKKAGKGSKSSKKGGPGGGHIPGFTPHPSYSPAESSSGDYGSPRPPTPISAPTPTPPGGTPTVGPAGSPNDMFTASPTDAGSRAIELSPFSLLYETATNRQASRAELAEVTDVTRLYLEEFMFQEFAGSSFTVLDDFITRMITSTFITGDAPYVIDYSATARFDAFSSVTPSAEQLDEALEIAFTGDNLAEYNSRLESISSDNVFAGALAFFGEPVLRVSKKPSNNAASIAAAAVAATLLAAGIVLYKRRQQSEYDVDKGMHKGSGDATVAGETFAGETYEGSASASIASLDHRSRSRDEDGDTETRGPRLLRTIEEDEDDDSVRPTWGANSSYDDELDSPQGFRNGPNASASFDSSVNRQNSADNESTLSSGTDNDGIRRVPSDGDSVAPSVAAPNTISPSQSFDDMALQGFTRSRGKEDDGESTDGSEGSSTHDSGRLNSQEMFVDDSKREIMSLLSHDNGDEQSIAGTVDSSGSRTTRRPRTVEEIEAMLSADSDDDDEEAQTLPSRTRSFGNDSVSVASAHRPRTVEEIESLLSAGLDDDNSVGHYADIA